jgi:hypothetical protein
MKEQKEITHIYEVVCDEGNLKYEDLKRAQEKIKRLYQSELFAYLVRKEFNKDGKLISEMLTA